MILKLYSGLPQSEYKTCTRNVPLRTANINPYFPGCFDVFGQVWTKPLQKTQIFAVTTFLIWSD